MQRGDFHEEMGWFLERKGKRGGKLCLEREEEDKRGKNVVARGLRRGWERAGRVIS